MNRMKSLAYPVLIAALLFSGCHRGGKAPTGQVVATFDGQEITTSDLLAEMGGAFASDPAVVARQQQAALQSVLARKVLAAEARKRGLDKSPAAAIAKQKAEEMALAGLLEQSIVANIPKVSQDEARSFVSEHPATFAQRQMLTLDQIVVPSATPALLKQLAPINAMADIKALLDKEHFAYQPSMAVVDTLNIDPAVAAKLAQLPAGGTFVTPAGGSAVVVSEIKERKPAPLSGPDAQKVATAIVTRQRRTGQLREQFATLMKTVQPKVKFNPQFQPKAAPGSSPPKPN